MRRAIQGGDVRADAEARLIAGFVEDIGDVQRANAGRGRTAALRRGFHAKQHAGITNAELRVPADLDAELRSAVFTPGSVHRSLVRFSNAAGTIRPDGRRDLRGVAIRVFLEGGAVQDFLLTNAPASHARDARQFMATATAFASRPAVFAPFRLAGEIGLREAWRVLGSLRRATARRVDSLATESYWSRAPFQLGANAVKVLLRPVSPASRLRPAGDDFLRQDLTERLLHGPVRFELCIQRFVDERTTPLEDGSIEWTEADAPSEPVAELFIPEQDLGSPEAEEQGALVDRLAFSPWNDAGELRPLGGMNHARRAVYDASAANRGAVEV